MTFLQPLFLIALSALAIPIIIHLFNFRKYKKIWFTNVRFIADIRQESKKRSQLRHLLILFMRLLAIACLVLAFAQPFIPSPLQKKKQAGKQAVSIYVDNSFSMEALASNGRLIDIAKARALEIAEAYKPSDLFQLITCDFEGRHQRFVNRDEFKTLVEELRISPASRNIPDVMKRQQDLLNTVEGTNHSVYLVSDFQKSTAGLQHLKADSTISCFFVPVAAEKQNNLYIDTIWFDSPVQQAGQQVTLKARFRNNSPEAVEKIPVKLLINNKQKTIGSCSAAGNGETEITLPFTNNEGGIQYGSLEITDYPVTWDDQFYFVYPIKSSVPLLCINAGDENPFLNALFQHDSSFIFKNTPSRQLDYSSFSRYSLIILNGTDEFSSGFQQELVKYVNDGGNILVFPPQKINGDVYNSFFRSMGLAGFSGIDTVRQRVSELNAENPVFRDVFEKNAAGKIILPENIDLPMVFRHYILASRIKTEQEDLLKLQNGQSFLNVTKRGKGLVYLCSVPLDESWSNFPKHPVFVPVLYKIALLSQHPLPLYYTIGKNDAIVLEKDSIPLKEVFQVRKLGGEVEFIPEIRSSGMEVTLYPHDQISEAGIYNILDDGKVIQGLAFNYDRKESDLTCYSSGELSNILNRSGLKYYALLAPKKAPLTKQIHEMSQGTPLWKLFILMALLFFAAEIALVRLIRG